jgi:hypothetical protein
MQRVLFNVAQAENAAIVRAHVTPTHIIVLQETVMLLFTLSSVQRAHSDRLECFVHQFRASILFHDQRTQCIKGSIRLDRHLTWATYQCFYVCFAL